MNHSLDSRWSTSLRAQCLENRSRHSLLTFNAYKALSWCRKCRCVSRIPLFQSCIQHALSLNKKHGECSQNRDGFCLDYLLIVPVETCRTTRHITFWKVLCHVIVMILGSPLVICRIVHDEFI